MVQSQSRQIVRKTLSQKRAGGVAQGVSPEFKKKTALKSRVFCFGVLFFVFEMGAHSVAQAIRL
jgi:hypothetical protein